MCGADSAGHQKLRPIQSRDNIKNETPSLLEFSFIHIMNPGRENIAVNPYGVGRSRWPSGDFFLFFLYRFITFDNDGN